MRFLWKRAFNNHQLKFDNHQNDYFISKMDIIQKRQWLKIETEGKELLHMGEVNS